MNGVAPVGPAPDYLPRREEELDQVAPASQPSPDLKSESAVKADVVKQAEKTTVYDFQYTGKGSFIDKIF